MSWTDPKTWATGDVLTASDMNVYLRDNMRWVGHSSTAGGAPMARRYHSANQNGFASASSVHYNTDRFTPVGFEVAATDNTRLTMNVGTQQGFLIVGAHVRLSLTYSSGLGIADLDIRDFAVVQTIARQSVQQSASGGVLISVVSAWMFDGFVADFDTQVLFQNYTNVDVSSLSVYSPEFWSVWVGAEP